MQYHKAIQSHLEGSEVEQGGSIPAVQRPSVLEECPLQLIGANMVAEMVPQAESSDPKRHQ